MKKKTISATPSKNAVVKKTPAKEAVAEAPAGDAPEIGGGSSNTPAKEAKSVTLDNLEDLEAHREVIVPPVLAMHGGMISILIHDESMADDSFTVTSILQGIANNLQRQKIKAEDIINDLETQEKHNLEGKFDAEGTMVQGPKVDEAGNTVGLSDNQHILMDKLDDQLDCISHAYIDLQKFWDDNNDNPNYKLFFQTDSQRRIAAAKYAAANTQNANTGTTEAAKLVREERKLKREARFAQQH